MLPTLTDLEIHVPTTPHKAMRPGVGEHERVALELMRARRMQRWADRFDRLSRRMSRTAYLRLARLP
ncbi:MAG TPA: hypothetical protein VFZ72_09240 [Jiangellaceae bacterium]